MAHGRNVLYNLNNQLCTPFLQYTAKAESNSNENVVIEQDEPYNVITEDDGGAKCKYTS